MTKKQKKYTVNLHTQIFKENVMNVNIVIIAGHLTRDVELSYTPSQTPVASFGMATNKVWYNKNGDKQEKVCFVDCVAFGKTASNLNKYLKKGDPLFIRGELQLESWEAQDGTKRSKHRVTVENFTFIPDGSRQEKQSPAENNIPDDDSIPF